VANLDNKTPLRPTDLTLDAHGDLWITWSDGVRLRSTVPELRRACPCATCREKRNMPPANPLQLTVLSLEETRPLTIAAMRPIGNYAYGISFSDGHDTGLFTLELLRELGHIESNGSVE